MRHISRQRWLGLLLLILLALPTRTEAQQREPMKQALWLGAKVGFVGSRFAFTPSVRQRLHQGATAGLALRYDIERGASLQGEVNYVIGGWRERYDSVATSYTRDLHYLETALLTHLYVNSGGTRIFLNLGPILGYQLSERSSSAGEEYMTDLDRTRHGLPSTHRFFWALGGGPGISFSLGQHNRLELEGRFVYNLGSIWSTARTFSYVQSTEMRFGVSLNYFYRLH